jgi:DNA polymerase III subunit chi
MTSSAERVDFYILPGSEERGRLKYACRLAEEAYLAGKRVFIYCDDSEQLERFDELLWSFSDRSFVPHEIYSEPQQWQETPVLLGCTAQPEQPFDVLVNLGANVPASAANAARIVELVDDDDASRRAGRNRFRHYRDQGLAPLTHTVAAEDSP